VLVASGADRLADAIVRVLTDETLRGRLATGGRRAVVERWSWDVAARAFSRVYEDVAAASERP
jgi:glycosyltransferase involved in cell wall biosynthesis